MITLILIALVVVLFVVFTAVRDIRPVNYPPGPSWWPFLGNGFMLRKLCRELKGQHLALAKLAEDYNTAVLGLKLGGDFVVVGITPSAVRAILTREVFLGRPVSFFMKLRCFGKIQGVTSTDGTVWKEQRKFTVRHLKDFGFGKETMDLMIMDEVKEIIQYLKEEKIVTNVSDVIAPSVLNVLWALATGKRLKKTDQKLINLLELLKKRSRAFDMSGGTLNQMPWLRFVAPKKSGYSLLQELNSQLKEFLMETINEQKLSYKPGETRNLIDAFFHEKNPHDEDHKFSDEELAVLLLDLFLGGAQTTSQTLDFAFLLMMKHPDVQEKAFACITDNVGRHLLPTAEESSKLIYIEAIILEVMRKCCVVPIIGPRRSLDNTTLNGYFVPKNTTLLINLYTAHHDESLFPEPHEFRPERFINSNGELIDQNNVLTFGLGKRKCLGEALAKSYLFQLFAGVLQNFEIKKLPGDEEPSLEPQVGLTLAPKPYSAQFLWRS